MYSRENAEAMLNVLITPCSNALDFNFECTHYKTEIYKALTGYLDYLITVDMLASFLHIESEASLLDLQRCNLVHLVQPIRIQFLLD
jgi:hypothetical protein